ncbi:MAG: hypothetical protein ACI9MR_000742 [Myxococcota bacterium]|jgi:hypothetical protein
MCSFDPITFSSQCMATCEWQDRVGCDVGTCVFSTSGQADLCKTQAQLFDTERLGENCTSGGSLQLFCNVVGDFADGYCDYGNVCQPICDRVEDCTEEGESCQFFLSEGQSLGFCGPPPDDG